LLLQLQKRRALRQVRRGSCPFDLLYSSPPLIKPRARGPNTCSMFGSSYLFYDNTIWCQIEQGLLRQDINLLPQPHHPGGQHIHGDPSKVEAVQAWSHPTTVEGIRGFLGPTGYYCKFIQNYGLVARPLSQLLKREAFAWDSATNQAFDTLNQALVTRPTL
jgi:hypothetical protein